MKKEVLAEKVRLFKLSKKYKAEPYPIYLAKHIIEYVHNIKDTTDNFSLTAILKDDIGVCPSVKNITKTYSYLCVRAGIERRYFKKHPNKDRKICTPKKRTYMNPLIQQHLNIAHQLMKEEDAKMEIYNEMKQLIGKNK